MFLSIGTSMDGGMDPARFDEIVSVEEKWTEHLHMFSFWNSRQHK
jgi:hypothetical protein